MVLYLFSLKNSARHEGTKKREMKVSGFSPAAGLKSGRFNRKRNFET
jgi:hypothetical protein